MQFTVTWYVGLKRLQYQFEDINSLRYSAFITIKTCTRLFLFVHDFCENFVFSHSWMVTKIGVNVIDMIRVLLEK